MSELFKLMKWMPKYVPLFFSTYMHSKKKLSLPLEIYRYEDAHKTFIIYTSLQGCASQALELPMFCLRMIGNLATIIDKC